MPPSKAMKADYAENMSSDTSTRTLNVSPNFKDKVELTIDETMLVKEGPSQ